MGNDVPTRTRSQTTGGSAPRGPQRIRSQTVVPPAVTENDFLREKQPVKQNPTEQDFLTRGSAPSKETDTGRKRNDEICNKLALGFAQVDTDRDGFIDESKVIRIYKQVCKLADAVHQTPVFTSNRVGFLQWNNLFKNIPASDRHLAKALKNIDFLSFKELGQTGSNSKSYIDTNLSETESNENRKKLSTDIPRKQSTGTPPSNIPTIVTLHSPISPSTSSTPISSQTTSSLPTTTPEGKKVQDTSKLRNSTNMMTPKSDTPILPTGKRPPIPNKSEKDKRSATGLRPPASKTGRRSRANTDDSDISAATSVDDVGDLDEVTDTEEADFGVADADLASTQPSTTSSPPTGVEDDDDDNTHASIIARANAVWS